MPTGGRPTLTQFLIEERRRHPDATGDLNALVTDVSLACKAISRKVAYGALGGVIAHADAAIIEEAREGAPSLQAVVDSFGHRRLRRQFLALACEPRFESLDDRL